MKNPNLIIACMAAVLLAAAIFTCYRWIHGIYKDRDHYATLYSTCMSAPVKIDTIHDSITIKTRVYIKPVPIRYEIHDTVFIQAKTSWYDDNYSKGGIRFKWKARVEGEIDSISFSDFRWPKDIITVRKLVDTCYDKPAAYKPMTFHWGLYAETMINNFKELPGVGVGGQVIIKDRLTLSVGGAYVDRPYATIRAGVLLK